MSSNRDQKPHLRPTAVTCTPAASVCLQDVVLKRGSRSAWLLGDFPWKAGAKCPPEGVLILWLTQGRDPALSRFYCMEVV